MSAVFNIVMTFYQLKELITVKSTQTERSNIYIDKIFNIEWVADGRKQFENQCPFTDMTVIHRMLLMGYVNPILMIFTVFACLICSKFWRNQSLLMGRFYVGYYFVLAFSYKNLCQTAFSLINCKTMNGRQFLYIDGSIDCFQTWQIANIAFLVLWVFLFPFAVGIGYQKLRNREIPRFKFMVLLAFLPLAVIIIACKKFIK